MKLDDKDLINVQEEYEKQLVIPEAGTLSRFILCPIGLIGSGKTTVIKPLSEKLGLVRVSGDEIRKLLKEKDFDWDRASEIVLKIGEKYLQNGYSVAVDSDCVHPEKADAIMKIADKAGAKVIWIHINPPEEFILNKLKSLKPNWLGTAEQMIDNYYLRKPLHKSLDFPFVYTFDTSKDNLENQINEAVEIIKKEVSAVDLSNM